MPGNCVCGGTLAGRQGTRDGGPNKIQPACLSGNVTACGRKVSASEIFHVNIGTKASIVGQVPSGMIRIFIEHDVVGVPSPVIDIGKVIGRDHPIASAKSEPARVAAAEAPVVLGTEAPVPATVFPSAVLAEVWIIAAFIVPNPAASVIDMGSVGVARLIAEVAMIVSTSVVAVLHIAAVLTVIVLHAALILLLALLLGALILLHTLLLHALVLLLALILLLALVFLLHAALIRGTGTILMVVMGGSLTAVGLRAALGNGTLLGCGLLRLRSTLLGCGLLVFLIVMVLSERRQTEEKECRKCELRCAHRFLPNASSPAEPVGRGRCCIL